MANVPDGRSTRYDEYPLPEGTVQGATAPGHHYVQVAWWYGVLNTESSVLYYA